MPFFFIPPLLVFGIIIFVFVMIIRAVVQAASSGGPIRALPQVTTQTAEDGFWILACPADPDDVVVYHYWSKGARYSGQVYFQPDAQGRQFVYTGLRPEQVAVVRIVSATVDPGPSLLPPVVDNSGGMWDPDPTPSQPSAPPSSSFPSAY